MPIFTADGRRRLGAITEIEARARNLTGADAGLAFNERDELVATNARAGVDWRERDSLPEAPQPRGWSGGHPAGGWSGDDAV